MMVVEKPRCRGCDQLTGVHVVGERALDLVELASALVRSPERAIAAANRMRVESPLSRQRPGALLELLEARRLHAQGALEVPRSADREALANPPSRETGQLKASRRAR